MSLLDDLLSLFSKKRKRRDMKKKRSEKKKKVARTTEILKARRSNFIPLPPDKK